MAVSEIVETKIIVAVCHKWITVVHKSVLGSVDDFIVCVSNETTLSSAVYIAYVL
jgi:hypothetical protein